jgi:hypothetical protein
VQLALGGVLQRWQVHFKACAGHLGDARTLALGLGSHSEQGQDRACASAGRATATLAWVEHFNKGLRLW